jgi:hypothetical protein
MSHATYTIIWYCNGLSSGFTIPVPGVREDRYTDSKLFTYAFFYFFKIREVGQKFRS